MPNPSDAFTSYPAGADAMSAERSASPDAGSIPIAASALTTSIGHDEPSPEAEQQEWWQTLLRLLGAVALAGLVLGALASGVLLLIFR